jgi:hypothetical protein
MLKAICTFRPYNCRKAINSQEDIRDDINKLLSYFGEMKACNKEFFFDFQLDDENRIKNIFWAPASCRGSYEDFGDCITFDTTYKTNRHSMPLGVFVGVNHHLQSTIFACALVRDESEDSFYWLFRTFLRCMNGKQPTIILTGLFTHNLLHISVRTYSIVNNITSEPKFKFACFTYVLISRHLLFIYRPMPVHGTSNPSCFL